VNGFTVVASFRDEIDAHAALAKLESEGIEGSLANEHLVGVLWTYSTAVGGVQVQVAPEDAEAAASILAADDSDLVAEIEAEMPGQEDELCPSCGSNALTVVRWQRYAAAVTLLVPLPLFIFRTRVKCKACGSQWKPRVA
jgi:hypothetical protein